MRRNTAFDERSEVIVVTQLHAQDCDLGSVVELHHTTYGNASTLIRNALKTPVGHVTANSLETTQLYILEDEAQVNGSHSPFDQLGGL